MKMHIVEGVYNSVQLEDGGLVNTKSEIREGSSEVYKARFYSFEDGMIHKLTLYIVHEILITNFLHYCSTFIAESVY